MRFELVPHTSVAPLGKAIRALGVFARGARARKHRPKAMPTYLAAKLVLVFDVIGRSWFGGFANAGQHVANATR